MGRSISSFKIGLFILLCGVLGIGAMIFLGIGHYFEKTKTYVTYFDESVKGLQTDAIVNFRGIPVGRVKSLAVAPDGRLVEVIMALNPTFTVNDGVTIRLKEMGLTGLRYLEIDTAPPNIQKTVPGEDVELKYPIIYSSPSDFQALRLAFESLYSKLSSIDLKGLASSWKETAENVNSILKGEELADTLRNLDAGSLSLKKAAQRASSFMDEVAKLAANGNMKGGLKDLSASLIASRKTLESLAKQMEAVPPNALAGLTQNLSGMASKGEKTISSWGQEVGQSLSSFRQELEVLDSLLDKTTGLMESLKEEPSSLLHENKPPDPFDRRKQ